MKTILNAYQVRALTIFIVENRSLVENDFLYALRCPEVKAIYDEIGEESFKAVVERYLDLME